MILLMTNIMVRAEHDLSHPELYGPIPYDWARFYSVQRVRKTALTLAKTISPTPDLLTVELGLHFSDTNSKMFWHKSF